MKSDVWWGDAWDGLDFGSSGEPEKPFFQQFAALQRKVPREGTSVVRAENCDYNSHTRDSKNCYLCHLSIKAEGLLYSYWTVGARDVIEGFYTTDCELCARCSYVTNCYNCVHVLESANCHDCYFSAELRSCSNCLFCCNLSGKQYHIHNRPCSRDEFEAEKNKYLNGDRNSYLEACAVLDRMLLEQPRRAQHSLRSENVVGDHILNSKDVYHAFDVLNAERGFNVTNGGGSFIVHSYSVGFPESSHVYCSVTVRNSSQIFFSANCWNSHQLWYCDNCVNCKDCFGCVGLKNRRFCAFNVQYSEAEYLELLTHWKRQMLTRGEWGHFFPVELSPYCYDESAAQDFFPLEREEILRWGWKCSPEKVTAAHESTTASAAVSPDVMKCTSCSHSFRVVPAERELASRLGIPISEKCPDCRLTANLRRRSPYSLVERSCAKCSIPVVTALREESARSVWCEKCFVQAVF